MEIMLKTSRRLRSTSPAYRRAVHAMSAVAPNVEFCGR
jgi:hypothetical protein